MISDLIKKFFSTNVSIAKLEELERFKKELEEKEEKKNFLKAFQELKEKKEESERSRKSLLNILEDITESEKTVKIQKKILDDTINYFIHGVLLFDKNEEILLINQKTFEIFDIKEIDDAKKENYKILKEDKDYIEVLKFLRQKNLNEAEISLNKYHLKINKVAFEKSGEIDCLIILNDITRDVEIQRAQSDFVALTAHQLRTPLSGIRWTLEMFLDETFGKLNKEQKEYIKQLSDNSTRLIKVVNRFLNVARIEQGRLIEKREIFDIVDIIDTNIKEMDLLIKEKEIDFSFDFSKDIITIISGDLEKLKIVIQNLIENAIRYTPKKGKIKIDLKNIQNNLIFSVKDDGYGIPKEEQEKIFTKFFRGSNIKKVDTEGSGLGLFVIKNIIEAHNGRIWLESEGENKGTTFYFTLPIVK